MKRTLIYILCLAFVLISCANSTKDIQTASQVSIMEEEEEEMKNYEDADLPPLHEACNHDEIDEDLIRKLVAEGYDINEYSVDRMTPLRLACNRSHIDKEAVKLLVELGAHIGTIEINRYTYEYSPLMHACNRSDIDADALRLLFELGAKPQNVLDDDTPLMLACDHSNIDTEAIKVLIDNGANLNVTDRNDRSLVMIALDHKDYTKEAVKLLLESGVDVNIGFGHSESKNKLITMVVHDLELTKMVVEHGARQYLDETDKGGTSVLSYAAAWGNKDVVRYLLDLGLTKDIQKPNKNGLTPIFFAAYSGNLDVVKMLVEAGADIHVKSPDGSNLLVAASRGKNNHVIYSTTRSQYYLHYASKLLNNKAPEPEMIQYFLDAGIAADEVDQEGWTPLHYAAMNPLTPPEVIKMLIQHGADPNAVTNHKHRTPLMFAASADTVRVLIKNGADVRAVDDNGWTALHFAFEEGLTEVAQALIKAGADIHAKTNSGEETIDYAETPDSIRLLGDKGVNYTDILMAVLQKESISERPYFHPKTLLALFEYSKPGNISQLAGVILEGINRDGVKQDEVSKILRYLKEHGTDINDVDSTGKTLLMQACNYEPVIFKELIDQGANIHQKTSLSTPLAYCASKVYAHGTGPQNIQLLIERGADVNVLDAEHTPALVHIAQKAPLLVPAMIAAGAHPNVSDREGNTPLMVTKSYSATQALIKAGADVNAKRSDGINALFIHSGAKDNIWHGGGYGSNDEDSSAFWIESSDKSGWSQGDYNISKLLIDAGAVPDGQTLKFTSNPRIIDLMFKTKNDVLLTGNQIKTSPNLTPEMVRRYMDANGSQKVIDDALNEACFWGNGSKIFALAKSGANPNTRYHYKNQTPLIMAVEESQSQTSVTLESIQALIDAGARLEDTDEDGNTALMAACYNTRQDGDRTKIIQLLLDSGADVKHRNKYGQNVLYRISNGAVTPDLLHDMIKRGADPKVTDDEGNTPLHNCWDAANSKVLIESGAKINAQNKEGETALMTALTHAPFDTDTRNLLALCQTLIDAGINLKATNKKGQTALFYATMYHHFSCADSMLMAGINPNIKDKSGKTAIEYLTHDDSIGRLLISYGAKDINSKYSDGIKQNKDR